MAWRAETFFWTCSPILALYLSLNVPLYIQLHVNTLTWTTILPRYPCMFIIFRVGQSIFDDRFLNVEFTSQVSYNATCTGKKRVIEANIRAFILFDKGYLDIGEASMNPPSPFFSVISSLNDSLGCDSPFFDGSEKQEWNETKFELKSHTIKNKFQQPPTHTHPQIHTSDPSYLILQYLPIIRLLSITTVQYRLKALKIIPLK